MLGIVFGTLCLIALFAVMRRERYRRLGYGYYRHGHFHGGGHFHEGHGRFGHHAGHSRHGGHQSRLHAILDRLDTTPGQDKAIGIAWERLRDRARALEGPFVAAQDELARAVSSDVLDNALLDASLARHAELSSELRGEAVSFVRTVHETLDARQRKELGRIIADGWLTPRHAFC